MYLSQQLVHELRKSKEMTNHIAFNVDNSNLISTDTKHLIPLKYEIVYIDNLVTINENMIVISGFCVHKGLGQLYEFTSHITVKK